MSRTWRTTSPEQTQRVGGEIADELKAPAVVLLIGDLGAGKTTLCKGLIAGLGAAPADDVVSPTFSLIHEYESSPKVYHIDLYRLDRALELETLGLDELWDENAIVLIEWGEKIAQSFPGPKHEIRLAYGMADERVITWGPATAAPRQ